MPVLLSTYLSAGLEGHVPVHVLLAKLSILQTPFTLSQEFVNEEWRCPRSKTPARGVDDGAMVDPGDVLSIQLVVWMSYCVDDGVVLQEVLLP